MRMTPLLVALSFAGAPLLASADVLEVPASGTGPVPVSVPEKGTTMPVVLKRYGQPQKKYAPVGGDAPTHPPITRWDYPGFSVFFERTHVVDAVVPGAPTEVYHTDQLKPAR